MENRGFILGTVSKSNSDLSILPYPHVHATKEDAIKEAKRLLQTEAFDKNRKVVVLSISGYVSINKDPFTVE